MQPADPALRRRLLAWLCAIALLGVMVSVWLERHQGEFSQWLAELSGEPQGMPVLLLALVAVLGLPLAVLALYFFGLGRRTFAAERFPLPGMAVVRDTPVQTGAAARRHGRALQALAVVLLLAAVALPAGTWIVFRSLAAGG